MKVRRLQELLKLLSKYRSQDMGGEFMTIGRSIYNEVGEEGKDLWRSVTMEEMLDLIDERWDDIKADLDEYRYLITHVDEYIKENELDVDYSTREGMEELLDEAHALRYLIEAAIGEEINKVDDKLYSRIMKELKKKRSSTENARLVNKFIDKYELNCVDDPIYFIPVNTIWTIAKMAKKDSPEEYDEWFSNYGTLLRCAMTDAKFGELTQRQFLDKWESVAKDDRDAMAKIRADMKRFIAIIEEGTSQYVVNGATEVKIIDSSKYESYLKRRYVVNDSYKPVEMGGQKGDKAKISLYDIFEPLMREKSLRYDGTCFSLEPKDGYLNMFRGYRGEVQKQFDSNVIDIIRNHIKDVLAAGNEEHATYIEQWIAHMFWNPEKVGVALFFIGGMGVGKTMFWERLIEYTLGSNNAFCTDTLQSITARFNGVLMNRRLVMANEVKGCTQSEYQRLKSLVTDKMISIEHKGVDLIQSISSHWFVFLSNYAEQFFIEDHDRRFAVFECGPKQDREYYQRLAGALEAGDDIITWLKSIYDKDFDLRSIPVSKLKKQMMKDNRHPVQQFLDGWSPDVYSSRMIYNDYKAWCQDWGYTPVPKNRMVASSGQRIVSLGQRMMKGVRDTYWEIK